MRLFSLDKLPVEKSIDDTESEDSIVMEIEQAQLDRARVRSTQIANQLAKGRDDPYETHMCNINSKFG